MGGKSLWALSPAVCLDLGYGWRVTGGDGHLPAIRKALSLNKSLVQPDGSERSHALEIE